MKGGAHVHMVIQRNHYGNLGGGQKNVCVILFYFKVKKIGLTWLVNILNID